MDKSNHVIQLNSVLFEGTITNLWKDESRSVPTSIRITMYILNNSKGKLTTATGKSFFPSDRLQPQLRDKVRVVGRLQEDSQGIYIEIEHLEYRRWCNSRD